MGVLLLLNDIKIFCKWILISVIVGLIVGFVGAAFHYAVEFATEIRHLFPIIILALPLGGLYIIWIYRVCGAENDGGTNFVIDTVRENKHVPIVTLPIIFIGTVVTHLFGGSSGREGAALQIGSSISNAVGDMFNLDEKDMHTMTMCGMAAAFAALFGTPVTAAVFSIEVISIGIMHFSALVPCIIAALSAIMTAQMFGVEATRFKIEQYMEFSPENLIKIVILSILCAFVSILFCITMKKISGIYKKYLPNKFVRVIVGGIIVIALTFIVGNRDYNGAGMDIITMAFKERVVWYAFLLKIIFTAFTLGAGYKGGEIVPAFFTGAMFGNSASYLIGVAPSFGTGIGLICLFCGVTNCPITSMILSVELFGSQGLPFFAAACATSYMLSGYIGLYSEQKIVYSKTKTEFIDKKAQ